MLTAELDYPLPEELIAVRPKEPRDSARLLVARLSGGPLEHLHVADLPGLLAPDDAMVFNTTSVAPARLAGLRVPSGGRVEGLFLDEVDPGRWSALLRVNGRLHPGDEIELTRPDGGPSGRRLHLERREADGWIARVEPPGPALHILADVGRTPIPPYIIRARHDAHEAQVPDDLDRRWYETVFADAARRRSVAAPTAGLHFTPELLDRLQEVGVQSIELTLDVGPGTFKPIAEDRVEAHPMHEERFVVEPAALDALRRRDRDRRSTSGGRLIAVGTTTVRTLESLPIPLPDPADGPYAATTRLLIAPPHEFRLVDGLLTNFHLPRSTLLALVAALVGLERLHEIYREAVARRYRFYSYGDAMLVLP